MSLKDSFFDKIKKKTNVDKKTIYDLAEKLKNNKSESTIREVIQTLSNITGKSVSDDTKSKIVSKINNNDVPKGIDKYFK